MRWYEVAALVTPAHRSLETNVRSGVLSGSPNLCTPSPASRRALTRAGRPPPTAAVAAALASRSTAGVESTAPPSAPCPRSACASSWPIEPAAARRLWPRTGPGRRRRASPTVYAWRTAAHGLPAASPPEPSWMITPPKTPWPRQPLEVLAQLPDPAAARDSARRRFDRRRRRPIAGTTCASSCATSLRPSGPRRIEAARAEDDVLADREGRGIDPRARRGSVRVVVDPHAREVVAEARFHRPPRRGSSGRPARRAPRRRWRARAARPMAEAGDGWTVGVYSSFFSAAGGISGIVKPGSAAWLRTSHDLTDLVLLGLLRRLVAARWRNMSCCAFSRAVSAAIGSRLLALLLRALLLDRDQEPDVGRLVDRALVRDLGRDARELRCSFSSGIVGRLERQLLVRGRQRRRRRRRRGARGDDPRAS